MGNAVTNRRWGCRVVAGAGCAAMLVSALTFAPAFASEGADADAGGGIAGITDQALDDTLQMLQDAGVSDANPAFRGKTTLEVTEGGKGLTLRYDGSADNAATLRAAIDSVIGKTAIPVTVKQSDFSISGREALATALMTPSSGLAKLYGIGSPTSAAVNQVTGEVSVTLQGPVPAGARLSNGKDQIDVDGVPVQLIPGAEVSVDFQVSRNADAAPWSGGIDMHNGSASLSQGFTWRKWGTGELMGSTAEHGYQVTGITSWYNNASLVGNRYYYNVAADTSLLRSSPGSSFNANMYIGSATTTERRWVVSAVDTIPSGLQTALNGASGLKPAATIGPFSFTIPGAVSGTTIGPIRYVNSSNCLSGDSGGPWIRTNNDGTIIAVGQHVGLVTNGFYGVYNDCAFVPVVQISSALSASIYTH